jgi:hypothetical protein
VPRNTFLRAANESRPVQVLQSLASFEPYTAATGEGRTDELGAKSIDSPIDMTLNFQLMLQKMKMEMNLVMKTMMIVTVKRKPQQVMNQRMMMVEEMEENNKTNDFLLRTCSAL